MEEKDDIEMNGGIKGIDNLLFQLEEEELMVVNGIVGYVNGKVNGVVEGKVEEFLKEIVKDSGVENILVEEKMMIENKFEDIQ